MNVKIALLTFFSCFFAWSGAMLIPHENLKKFENNGNQLTGVATPSLGAQESEVWHGSIAVGSQTPIHTHEAEEIVILINGSIEATVDNKTSSCTGPCTIILPANKTHQLKNIGGNPTSHYSIVRLGSKVLDEKNQEMNLPWRK